MPSEEQSEASKAADEDGQKLKELFKKLDVNQDGRIDIDDLTSALDTMNVPQVPDHAQVGIDSVTV